MADRWEKFLRDQEWIKIKKETGEMYGPLVGEMTGSHLVSDGLFTSVRRWQNEAGRRNGWLPFSHVRLPRKISQKDLHVQ